MIRLNNIHKSYEMGSNKLHVLQGINMHVKSGEFVSIMGASGSGKSTLLNIIGLLDNYDTGEYYIGDRKIENLSQTLAAKYRNEFVGFVFQSFNLLSYKTALENVALPLYYRQIPRKKRNKIAMEYLERVGIKDWSEHTPNEMSGGQKQRVAIARALIAKPRIILADEPTGALDSQTSMEVMNLLKEVNEEGTTLIMVTHEKEVAAFSQRTIRIKDGLIIDEE